MTSSEHSHSWPKNFSHSLRRLISTVKIFKGVMVYCFESSQRTLRVGFCDEWKRTFISLYTVGGGEGEVNQDGQRGA